MNAIKPDTENEVICYCSGTTAQQIKQLLDDGTTDLERISRITGTASGCGGCEFEFHQLVAEHTQEA
ncbi:MULTISPECIES: (2Fe-2S)-binding protein [Methylomonas]|uniref:(2Fe-2S)-binding protein n=2 Tax=Methylomonas TaxID=416 RepID=A0A126T3M4_9GAMM|nr:MULTISPECIES: (2Fe-2S)-binding protein [Methylomonas]AMK76685.1 (2Fe-2S)-binding protein [Methylomonas denitrificans]OAI00064.1 (2Fe-2S)-binding protein [Methylomonas methanica]TCV82824.1 BFD-like [2Fe-2S] binding protein [Methylomonas methanica]